MFWGLPRPQRCQEDLQAGRNFFDSQLAHRWPEAYHGYISTAFGLAQHHGIPTRLLGWTRKPMVAAFFAADFPHHELEEYLDAYTTAGVYPINFGKN